MNQKTLTAALVLAALASFPLAAAERKSGDPRPAPTAEAGMKIHVDPATGQLVAPKSDPDAARNVAAAAPAEASPQFKVEKVTTNGKGRMVHLNGRLMMEMTATVGPDGKVSHGCDQIPNASPKAAPTKEHRHDR